jgi:hypothetical protein
MKNSLPMHPMMMKIAILATCLLLVMVYNKSKAQGLQHPPAATTHTIHS